MAAPNKKRHAMGECPECNENIPVRGEAYSGSFVTCPSCLAVLQVVRTTPLLLAPLEEPFVSDARHGYRPGNESLANDLYKTRRRRDRQREAESADCPECITAIRFKKTPTKGQRLKCRHCGAELTVISIRPLLLD